MGSSPMVLLLAVLVTVSFNFVHCNLENENSPAFYCFVNPPVNSRLSPSLLSNISACTHLVYGAIPIDRDTGYPEYSVSDVGHDIDNIRTFLRMKSKHPTAKLLMGVVREKPFEDSMTAKQVAEGLRKHVKGKRFDGVFVTFNGIHLEYRSSIAFLNALSLSPSKPQNISQLSVTFSISARRVFAYEAVKRLREINELVEHIYLDMGELPSNSDPRQVTHINPLYSNGSDSGIGMEIPFEETIQGTVEELSTEGILPPRIIIGLTAGGWKFQIKDSQDPLRTVHGEFAERPGVRVTYQDACRARGAVIYDYKVMNEVTVYRQTWTSVNLPVEKALGEKIKWILNGKFAGFGINGALADDPEGTCGTDPLPAHRLAMDMLRNTIPSNPAKCTRLCYLEDVEDTFPLDNLKSEYCSHLVVRYFDLDLTDLAVVSEKSEALVKKIDEWRTRILEVAPKLILSVGSRESTGIWQFLLGNDFKRKALAESLVKSTLKSSLADGLEISWTLEPMASEFDKKNLKAFIDDVRAADPEGQVELLVATTAGNAYHDLYDYQHLNATASLIVLHTHRLHSEITPFTGHPSPLRAISSMRDPKMSWEEVLKHWVAQKVLRSKLVLSLSASTLSMQSIGDVRSETGGVFGQPAFVSMLRSKKMDIHSQQEICESIQSGHAVPGWVPHAEVPFLRRIEENLNQNQLVAYESIRSAHIKTIWASMESVGGMALHHVQQDDPHAICDNRTAFPLLNAMTRAQTCHKCVKQHNFRKCAGAHEFVVSCGFDLRRGHPIFKTDIVPYERCTEVVVEQATLTLGGNVTFADEKEEEVVRNLTQMREKMIKCGMVLGLSCGGGDRADMHLNYILGDNMTNAINNVMTIMDKYKFSGVQLDCEKAIRRGNHIFFNTFVRKLAEKFEKTKASNGCNRTLSARFSHYTKTPSTFYSISLLNKLSHISLKMSDSNRIDLPFFQNSSNPSYPSTEKFVKIWKNAGLKTDKLVLELSPFGYQETTDKRKNQMKKTRMSQGQSCETVGNRARFQPDFENLMGQTQHQNGTVHMPMAQDLRYKIGYVRRENLRGIALNSVNGDDYVGICGRGSFPILKSVYSNEKCR